MIDVSVLGERVADIDRWVSANHMTVVAGHVEKHPPVHPDDVAAVEAMIREVDPSGLPARCETCHARLPMIARSDRWHPKCTPPF